MWQLGILSGVEKEQRRARNVLASGGRAQYHNVNIHKSRAIPKKERE